MPDVSWWTCSDCCARFLWLLLFCTRDCRCIGRPASPTPSFGRNDLAKLGRIVPRNMRLCLSRHGPPTTSARRFRESARNRAQERMPLVKALQVVLSFGDGCLSSSSPKPTSTVSSPSVRLKSATIGSRRPSRSAALSLPHSSSARAWPAASGFMFSRAQSPAGWNGRELAPAVGRQPRRDIVAKSLTNFFPDFAPRPGGTKTFAEASAGITVLEPSAG